MQRREDSNANPNPPQRKTQHNLEEGSRSIRGKERAKRTQLSKASWQEVGKERLITPGKSPPCHKRERKPLSAKPAS